MPSLDCLSTNLICFFAAKRKVRIVTDIIAILIQILCVLPENAELIEKIVFCNTAASKTDNDYSDKHSNSNDTKLDLIVLLRHSSAVLRTRMCILLRLIARFSCRTLQLNWDDRLKETLEALAYDSMEAVRNVIIYS